MLVFGLRSTSDDQMGWSMDSNSGRHPSPAKKNKMLIFGLRSTSDDWLSNPSNESRPKCGKRPPKSLNNEMLILDYTQLLMIGQAIRVTKVDQNVKK